jgi:hypothetical protein
MGKPFKNREELEKEIRLCGRIASIMIYLSLGSTALGVIGDALNITLILESISWFLLAILFVVFALIPGLNVLEMRLCGIEAENKIES